MRGGGRESGFRQAALTEALDRALQTNGDPSRLYDQLARASGLPGIRANEGVIQAFAVECTARGKTAFPLVESRRSGAAPPCPPGSAPPRRAPRPCD